MQGDKKPLLKTISLVGYCFCDLSITQNNCLFCYKNGELKILKVDNVALLKTALSPNS